MKYLTTLVLLLFAFTSSAQWQGKVVEVTDGDTYEIKKGSETVTVRAYGIDCPESNQPYGKEATRKVRKSIKGQPVKVEKITTGTYGRTIGKVYFQGTMVNEWLISKGLAWVYGRYCDQSICERWESIQKDKRANEVGLWSQSNPVAPWEFRH